MEDRIRQEKSREQKSAEAVEEQKLAEAREKQKMVEAMEIQKIMDAMERQALAGAVNWEKLTESAKGWNLDDTENEGQDDVEDEMGERPAAGYVKSVETMDALMMGVRMTASPEANADSSSHGPGMSRGHVAYRQTADMEDLPDRQDGEKPHYRRA